MGNQQPTARKLRNTRETSKYSPMENIEKENKLRFIAIQNKKKTHINVSEHTNV